jgi:hypothetical protein
VLLFRLVEELKNANKSNIGKYTNVHPFLHQALTIIETDSSDTSSYMSSNSAATYSKFVSRATRVLRIKRNTSCCVYVYKGFSKHLHLSESTLHCKRDNEDRLFSILSHLPFEYIKSKDTYKDKNLYIVNYNKNVQGTPEQNKLLGFKKDLIKIFPAFQKYMHFDRKRNVCSFSGGYSTLDANAYKSNRITSLGNVKPSLSKKLNTIEKKHLIQLGTLIWRVVNYMVLEDKEKLKGRKDTLGERMRRKMQRSFCEQLGIENLMSCDKQPSTFIEGFSLIINEKVNPHWDHQNDHGQRDVTYSVNCTMAVTEDMYNCSVFGKLVQKFNKKVGDPITVSLMMYSRKCLGYYESLYNNVEGVMMNTDNPILPTLIESFMRVDCETNYSRLWDDPDVYKHGLKWNCPSQNKHPYAPFANEYSENVATFDKMVSTCYIVSCLCFF